MHDNDDIIERLVQQGFLAVEIHNARVSAPVKRITLADTIEGQAAFVLSSLAGQDNPLLPPIPGETTRERQIEFLKGGGYIKDVLRKYIGQMITREGTEFLTDAQIRRLVHLYIVDERRSAKLNRASRAHYRKLEQLGVRS